MTAQLALFSEPVKPRLTVLERQEAQLMSPVIEQALLDACKARPGEWLDHELHRVAEALGGGSVWGHVLTRLVRKGLLEEKRVYYGSESPGDPGEYKGFGCLWRYVPKEEEPCSK